MVYTRRLFAGQVPVPNEFREIYRAPPTGTVVIRDVVFVNASGVTLGNIGLQLRPLSRALPTIAYWIASVPTGTVHADLRQAMAPSESLEAYATASDYVYVLVTGYVFDS